MKTGSKVEKALRMYEKRLSYQQKYQREKYEKITIAIRKKDIEESMKKYGFPTSISLEEFKEKYPEDYAFIVKSLAADKLDKEIFEEAVKRLQKSGKLEETQKQLEAERRLEAKRILESIHDNLRKEV